MTQAWPGRVVQGWTHDQGKSALGLGWDSGKGGIFLSAGVRTLVG